MGGRKRRRQRRRRPGNSSRTANVTREQIATILYRYAGLRGVPTGGRADLSSFRTAEPSAAGPMTPVVGQRGGTDRRNARGRVDYLAPQQNATRAQVAVILMRYLGAA